MNRSYRHRLQRLPNPGIRRSRIQPDWCSHIRRREQVFRPDRVGTFPGSVEVDVDVGEATGSKHRKGLAEIQKTIYGVCSAGYRGERIPVGTDSCRHEANDSQNRAQTHIAPSHWIDGTQNACVITGVFVEPPPSLRALGGRENISRIKRVHFHEGTHLISSTLRSRE
jgi:hypothetical protein